MEENIFEFKGVLYKRCSGGEIIRVNEPSPKIVKEKIPDHLRNLNKRQLRERILIYEILVEQQNNLLKEFQEKV